MTDIPLPIGYTSLDDFPRLRENLINCFNPNNKILPLPGLSLFASGFGLARGQALFKELAYQVSGTRFIRINEDGSVDNVGQIVGIGKVQMAKTFTELAIVNVQTGDGFVFDGSTLTAIASTYVASVDVTTIDGRAVYVPADGGPVFYSVTNDLGNIGGFFDAEVQPDRNIGVITYRGDLYVLGENSIEIFRSTGNDQFPFIRSSGAAIPTGYVAGKIKWAGTFAFLGRVTDDGYSFYAMGNGEGIPLSSPEIDEILEKYTLEELQTCVGQTFLWKGYQVLQFTIDAIEDGQIDRTFSFVNDRWFFMESGIGGPNVNTAWRAKYITFAYGGHILGDRLNGNIGIFSENNLEYGQTIEREILTFIRLARGSYFEVPSITIDTLVGTNSVEGTMGLQTSSDGFVYGPQMWRNLGNKGDYKRRIIFDGPGGLGNYENFCGIRLRVTEQVELAADAIQIDE